MPDRVSIDHAVMRCDRSANEADGSSPIGPRSLDLVTRREKIFSDKLLDYAQHRLKVPLNLKVTGVRGNHAVPHS